MHPHFIQGTGAEHGKDLMREADRRRLAHPGAPEARRWAKWWAKWWVLRRRARGNSGLVVVAGIQTVVAAGAQPVAPASAQMSPVDYGTDLAIGRDGPQTEAEAGAEVPESDGSLIDLDRASEELEQTGGS